MSIQSEINASDLSTLVAPKFEGTVRMLLLKQIKASFLHPQFVSDVLKPMALDGLMDQTVTSLSGGESVKQRYR